MTTSAFNVVILDSSDKLTPFWDAGSVLARVRLGARIIRARSWGYALDRLDDIAPNRPGLRLNLQVWGHGNDGDPLIGGSSLSLEWLRGALPELDPRSTIWWRSCEVHKGMLGESFARNIVSTMGCASVGHLVVTNLPNPMVQGKICALTPDDPDIWWDRAGRVLRGCSTLRMRVPAFAYRRRRG